MLTNDGRCGGACAKAADFTHIRDRLCKLIEAIRRPSYLCVEAQADAWIATINFINRVNATTRQISGNWVSQYISRSQPVERAV
jgi:hypothetical protein